MMEDRPREPKKTSAPIAALMAWLLPGLGHWWIGERGRAVIFFLTTAITFWAGVAVAGVRSTVTPKENGLWIAAQLFMGPQAIAVLRLSDTIAKQPNSQQFKAPWPASDIGVVYAGVAGLLNLLIIFDVLSRIESSVSVQSARSPPKHRRQSR